MSPAGITEKLSSLEHRYSESIRLALDADDHAAAERLGSTYHVKAQRLRTLRDPHLSPLRRMVLRTLTSVG